MISTKRSQTREAARAAIGTTPGDMLDAIIERGEAARSRYLGQLAKPQPRSFSPHRCRRLLTVLELRLKDLQANREARKRPA